MVFLISLAVGFAGGLLLILSKIVMAKLLQRPPDYDSDDDVQGGGEDE